MHLLPTNLAPLADIAAKTNTGRFALETVHLRVHGDNTFIASATDTHVLLRVTGPCVGPADEYPEHPGMTTAPNGNAEALIPAKAWAKAFSNADKVTKKQPPRLKTVAVKMSKEMATFGATNLDSYPVEQTRLVEGRFPPVADIVDQARKHAKARVRVDPLMMAKALKAIATVGCDDMDQAVEILINGQKPMMIRAERADGIKAEVILMPLTPEKEEEKQEAELEVNPEEIEQLREELEKLKGERDFLNEELANAQRQIEELTADADRLMRTNERLQEVLEGRENQITELVQERNGLREQLQSGIKVECDRPSILSFPPKLVQGQSRRERLQRIGIPS